MHQQCKRRCVSSGGERLGGEDHINRSSVDAYPRRYRKVLN